MKNQKNLPTKIQRANLSGLIFEYLLHSESTRTLILLDGLPTVPNKKETIERLHQSGFNVFYPRYRGTWESEGVFLDSSPSNDIKELIETIVSGIKLGNTDYVSNDIRILSSSFGGAVAWELSEIKEVKDVVLLSPVYDFVQVVGISTLRNYLRENYTMGYRFSDVGWDNLILNRLITSPEKLSAKARSKCYVIGGALDPQIKADDLRRFCIGNEIGCRIYPEVPHLSLSPSFPDIWTDILEKLSITKATNFIGKMVSVKIDRPLNSLHPKHNFKYELNYGFIPDTISPDGEELDAYIMGVNQPIDMFNGKCIAVIHRENDDDDKLVVVPPGFEPMDEEIRLATNFQEKFFKSEIIR